MPWPTYILYFVLLVHTAQLACFLAMARGHVLHFGPRKAMGLRLAVPSQAIAKRVFGVDYICFGGGGTDAPPRRNNSLSSGGKFLFLGSLAAVIVAISPGFAFNGAWLVLPFAGLDLLALVMAFRYLERHTGDYECMSVRGDQVAIELWDRGSVSGFEFNRYWAQVVFRAPGAWKAASCHCGLMEAKWRSASI